MNFHKDFEFLVKEIVGAPNKSLLHIVITLAKTQDFSKNPR